MREELEQNRERLEQLFAKRLLKPQITITDNNVVISRDGQVITMSLADAHEFAFDLMQAVILLKTEAA